MTTSLMGRPISAPAASSRSCQHIAVRRADGPQPGLRVDDDSHLVINLSFLDEATLSYSCPSVETTNIATTRTLAGPARDRRWTVGWC